MVKLLIFIPTYRRPAALTRQLQAIAEWRIANDQVEIHTVVSQNERSTPASCLHREGIEFRFNPANMGADINIALGFTLCDSYDYLWILSDDDFLRLPPPSPIPLPVDCDLLVFDDALAGTSEKRTIQASDLLQSRMGLISDVIYRVDAVRHSIAESLLNVRSCFPHLSVIAAAFGHEPARIRYHSRRAVFNDPGTYAGECATDYSAARTGILLTGKYLQHRERCRFARLYARHADLSRLSLFGVSGSLSSAIRATFALSPLTMPLLVALYIARKVQNRALRAR